MNIYAEIAAKYLSVAGCHDALAVESAMRGERIDAAYHRNRATSAREWSQHYSRLAHDVNDREAAAHDEETCHHADHR